MQTDHRVPMTNTVAMRQQQQKPQHRKRSFSSVSSRKRDRHDLICVVCHAPAMGYNFDQITCESCKAFFRRNALSNADKFKCRSGVDDCPITLETRKRCKACRLKKCFDRGLRKEWIMSEEEKRTKKQKIEDNRRLRAMSQTSTMFSLTPSSSPPLVPETEDFHSPIDYHKRVVNDDEDTNNAMHAFEDTNDFLDIKPSADVLNQLTSQKTFDYKALLEQDDRLLLTTIEQNYTRAVQLNVSMRRGCDFPRLRNLTDVTDLVNEPAQIGSLRMITFLKLTPEFHVLHEDDRMALVKHNLLPALYLHLCMCVDMQTGIYHEPNSATDFCYYASELRRYSDHIYEQSMTLVHEVREICANDHLIIKLAMLILIFSKGSDFNEPTLLQPQEIFHAQNVYATLLWKYFDARFETDQTASMYSRLIFACMKAQILARLTKESLAKKTLDNDQLAPLMQSVFLNA